MLTRKENTISHSAPYDGLTGLYTIDPVDSTIIFSLRHALISTVRGQFTDFEGLLRLDGTRPTRSRAYLSVQTGSLCTGFPERDRHVTGPDFLDSAAFPLLCFRSAGIRDGGGDRFRMAGHLLIKDIELPVHIDLEFGGARRDAYGRQRVGFQGTTTLQRSDWGLGWNAAPARGGLLTSDKVKLVLAFSAVQLGRSPAAPAYP